MSYPNTWLTRLLLARSAHKSNKINKIQNISFPLPTYSVLQLPKQCLRKKVVLLNFCLCVYLSRLAKNSNDWYFPWFEWSLSVFPDIFVSVLLCTIKYTYSHSLFGNSYGNENLKQTKIVMNITNDNFNYLISLYWWQLYCIFVHELQRNEG